MVGAYPARGKRTLKQNRRHNLKEVGALSQYEINSNSILNYLYSPAISV